jgi:hypothetical protein
MLYKFDNITENSFLLVSVFGMLFIAYYRTLRTCLLTRISHCEIGCIKIDNIPISDNFNHEILEVDEENKDLNLILKFGFPLLKKLNSLFIPFTDVVKKSASSLIVPLASKNGT